MTRLTSAFILIVAMSLTTVQAGESAFKAGPVFEKFGKHAAVPGVTIAPEQSFKVAFDVADGAQTGALNQHFNKLARFINMHVANGARLENLQLALVVHGSATLDVVNNKYYKKRTGEKNANAELLKALQEKGVRVIVCGQSSAKHGVSKDMLIEGVEMDLSAMTAHARLAQEGYTTNPF
ncbi:DsrE family protein [Salinimonas marina]|uniref:DsrE family protein n=1 Tax=Salinimonas marina TaxID=2785918 RepID=A0A7S9DZD3_9ALTE|nr:DsrE family protein [Salinimonas marina]QPG06705.1 DsrE family protein [Salinimonas marina]